MNLEVIWRTLLSFPRKILSKIIIKWISNTVDQELGKEQVRFREGKECSEQIFSFKISSGNEWKRQLCINFYKAVDSIHRDSLFLIYKRNFVLEQNCYVCKSEFLFVYGYQFKTFLCSFTLFLLRLISCALQWLLWSSGPK